MTRWAALVLIIGLVGCGTDTPEPVSLLPLELRVLDYGLYDAQLIARHEAEYTESGHLSEVTATLDRRTRRVPMVAGETFGFEFVIRDPSPASTQAAPARTLTFIVQHPPMTEPDGEVSAGFTHIIQLTPEMLPFSQHFMFTFSEPFEMVAGHWLLTIREGDHELARQPFEVGPPAIEESL